MGLRTGKAFDDRQGLIPRSEREASISASAGSPAINPSLKGAHAHVGLNRPHSPLTGGHNNTVSGNLSAGKPATSLSGGLATRSSNARRCLEARCHPGGNGETGHGNRTLSAGKPATILSGDALDYPVHTGGRLTAGALKPVAGPVTGSILTRRASSIQRIAMRNSAGVFIKD